MNKKNLSVVMAGAMLATSVAPVLASETTSLPESITVSQKALLKQGIKTLMDSEKIENETRIAGINAKQGESIYGVQILDKDGKFKSITGMDSKTGISYNATNVSNAIDDLKEGDTVKVFERAHNEFLGLNIVTTVPEVKSVKTYSDSDLETIKGLINSPSASSTYTGLIGGSNALNSYIKQGSATTDTNADGKKTLTFKLNALTDISNSESNRTVTITAGDNQLNFNMPIGKDSDGKDVLLKAATYDGNVTSDVHECVGFYQDATYETVSELKDPATEKSSTKITAATDATKDTYLVSELYDGFALTAAGTELATLINNDDRYETKYYCSQHSSGSAAISSDADISANAAGITDLVIDVKNKTGNTTDSIRKITVYSTNVNEVKALYNILNGEYKVGVIGGSNRYETAVNVAKAQGIDTFNDSYKTDGQQNIVLVNGESLVDGLAAAPLANKLGCYSTKNSSTKTAAPVLLSSADKLSTATKDYINELTKEFTTTEKGKVTVTLVGGKTVLSDSIKTELEGMGFKVNRLGGDNREETSLKVASAIKGNGNINEAFVVGANGEADAMSISPVASQKTAPIIVSSVHGLTDDAMDFVSENKKATFTVVGGDAAVSATELNKLSDVAGYDVSRIAGDNRFETNAKIIDKYYGSGKTFASFNGAVAVKDGQANKSELIDALSAANYAAKNNAPIVLASKEVKDVQKNAILENKVASSGKIVQVGEGADISVLKTLSNLMDIVNIAK